MVPDFEMLELVVKTGRAILDEYYRKVNFWGRMLHIFALSFVLSFICFVITLAIMHGWLSGVFFICMAISSLGKIVAKHRCDSCFQLASTFHEKLFPSEKQYYALLYKMRDRTPM